MELRLLSSLTVFWFFSGVALACSPVYMEYRYAAKDGQLVYERWSEDKTSSVESRLTGVNLARFHRVLPLTDDAKSWLDGIRYFNDPNYFTDNNQMFYNGKPMVNPVGAPAIDAKSFTQPFNNFSFAVDKFSIYYRGERTDANSGAKRVDLASLKPADEHILMDANNLYHAGKFIGVAQGFEVLKTQEYVVGSFCYQGNNVIARNRDTVFVNGIAISTDVNSFKIKRWMPDILLDYTDKNGSHSYYYGLSEADVAKRLTERDEYVNQGFYPSRDKVFYTKRLDSKSYRWTLVEIPGTDPELFSLINARVATDGHQLYVLEGKMDGRSPLSLSVSTLDSPVGKIAQPYVIGQSNIYFINENGVQSFELNGVFVPLNHYYAHDDKYVYVFDEPYKQRPVQRFRTSNIQMIKLKEPERADSDLIMQEGIYLFGDKFQPTDSGR